VSYLIDTCAISELVRARPDANVVAWFEAVPQDGLYLSVLTLGEIRKGIAGISDRRRFVKIAHWLEHDLPGWFENRVLAIDAAVADEWGRLLAKARQPLPAIDSLIAATALRHRLTVVTRNVKDFESAGVDVMNPWEA